MEYRGWERDVLCFQHCDRYINIFCFTLPDFCPVCRRRVSDTPCRIPPYVIPSPFKQAWKYPCSVVIRPTFGTFLESYTNTGANSLLHVGITASNGTVYDYDEDGVNVGSEKWNQSIVVDLANQGLTQGMLKHWDHVLKVLSGNGVWTRMRYDADRHNCYDFVLTFLQQVGFNFENWASHSRLSFTQNLVLPQTTRAAKYITLYRNITKDEYFCQTSPDVGGINGPV